jgi:hypothetical protein
LQPDYNRQQRIQERQQQSLTSSLKKSPFIFD